MQIYTLKLYVHHVAPRCELAAVHAVAEYVHTQTRRAGSWTPPVRMAAWCWSAGWSCSGRRHRMSHGDTRGARGMLDSLSSVASRQSFSTSRRCSDEADERAARKETGDRVERRGGDDALGT